MPPSEIRRLIDALEGEDSVGREAAIARLAVIGQRAVDRLIAIYDERSTSANMRVAILRVLEAAGDPRGVAIGRHALAAGGDVAVAATGTLRALLDVPNAEASALALDALVATALDRKAERRVRLAAFESLQAMPDDIRGRVAAALRDTGPIAAATTLKTPEVDGGTNAAWLDAMEGRMPDDPTLLRSALRVRGASAPLSSLHKLVVAARQREAAAGSDRKAEEWRVLRGALHQALALRGSSVAVYDLRETIAAADRALPPSYVAALQAVGDASCLEAIAAALSRAPDDESWRYQLKTAFVTIAKRQKGARQTAMRRIAARWPDAAALLSTPSRTTPRPTPRVRI